MKTLVIQLEGYDDVISIKDKMAWQSCRRVLLVWPKRGKILANELELVLLQRAAKANGADLALVSHHPVIMEWALEKEIPLFASINAAERSAWKSVPSTITEKRFPRGVAAIKAKKLAVPTFLHNDKVKSWWRMVAMAASLAALLALFLVIFPLAEITYYPQVAMQETEMEFSASEEQTAINPAGGIPAFPVFIETSAELSCPSSGITTVATSKAQGIVSLTNLSEQELVLPEGSFLVTNEEEPGFFVLKRAVTLPAGIGETLQADAEALLAGEKGNIDAERIVSIAGEAGSQVQVTNEAAFTGGTSTQVPTPNGKDYEILKEQLLTQLAEQAQKNLIAEDNKGVQLIQGSVQLEEILLEEQLGEIGQPFDEATLRITARFKGLSFKQSDLETVAKIILDADITQGYVPLGDSLEVSPVDQVLLDQSGRATWKASVSRRVIPGTDFEQAAVLLSGKSMARAKTIFAGLFEQTQSASFKNLLPWMPFLSTRIKFINGALP